MWLYASFLSIFLFSFPFSSLSNAEEFLNETFDFIVVGGGVAGCVVASRLSENGEHTVLLLEAGGYSHRDLETPALGVKYIGDPRYTRIYPVPQKNAALKTNGIVSYMIGWVLGGGSAINGMNMNRGNPLDYDAWANASSDTSWNYVNMLKYFKKLETYEGEFPSEQHGNSGPIRISRHMLYAPLLEEWYAAGKELGLPIADPNGPQKLSFAPLQYSMRKGRRVSSYDGYVKPHLGRPNLRVVVNAQVSKVRFEGTKCVGVTYNDAFSIKIVHVKANLEVILSAGVIGSPAILMKSGVGPKEVLHGANIPTVKNLPVGMNFQDHTASKIDIVVHNKSVTKDLTLDDLEVHRKFGDGPYAYHTAGPGQVFFSSSIAKRNGNSDWPDCKATLIILSSDEKQARFNLSESEAPISVGISIRTKSRGRVLLSVSDINLPPMIEMEYLSHPDDIQVLVDAIKFVLEIFEKTEAFKTLGARYATTPIPGCEDIEFRSDEYWKCYARQTTATGAHGAGTCRMGYGEEDPDAVVDSKLRVIGIQGLRVVDASIMPLLINVNPMAAVYAISEKGADMILQRHRKPRLLLHV